ncbi:MAG: UvrD-helicase domain-containing protein [Elusimicrobiota bacterium]|jgi:DNA helicase-2/ATP-dependent DNA helicase PcrA
MSEVDTLNPEQQEAVAHRGGPLLVLAGAGTGKTRVIVHRVAALIRDGVPPERILAVTFTNKAADEMRRRIDLLAPGSGGRVWAHTFHAFSAKLLRIHAEKLKLPKHFTIYDSDDQKKLVVEVLKELGLEKEKNKASIYVNRISRAKDDLLDPGSYGIYAMAQRDPHRETAARVYEGYQRKLDVAGALDFGDLLMKGVELLRDHEDVRTYYQERFLHVLVDEYQDTNHAQYMMTKALAAKHRELCVVGDPDQLVYSWRGAHMRNIMEFETDFSGAKTVRLERNYRSTPEILKAASCVIVHNRQRYEKNLLPQKPSGLPVEVEEAPDEREEARVVTRRIVRLLSAGLSPKDVAVFYRTNAQSRSFEEALTLSQVPHRVVGAVRFYERREVKDVLAYARVAINPDDSISFGRILNLPPRGLGDASVELFKEHARLGECSLFEAFRGAARIEKLKPSARRAAAELVALIEALHRDFQNLGPTEAVEQVIRRSGYWAWLEAEAENDPEEAARLDNVQELLNAVREFEEHAAPPPAAEGAAPSAPRLTDFLESAALQTGADGYDADRPSVTLMTVHLAKGLEFPAVFLTGLEEGLFPITSSDGDPDSLEEERRLCYVGMTRARERLVLTHAATRHLFGRLYSNLPSRFVFEAGLLGRREEPAAVPADGSAPPPVPAAAPKPALRVRVGLRVKHPEFGRGEIVEKSGAGEMLKVTVRFDSGVTKKLLLRYAPLSPA